MGDWPRNKLLEALIEGLTRPTWVVPVEMLPASGWQCPRCQRVWAPSVKACECVPPDSVLDATESKPS